VVIHIAGQDNIARVTWGVEGGSRVGGATYDLIAKELNEIANKLSEDGRRPRVTFGVANTAEDLQKELTRVVGSKPLQIDVGFTPSSKSAQSVSKYSHDVIESYTKSIQQVSALGNIMMEKQARAQIQAQLDTARRYYDEYDQIINKRPKISDNIKEAKEQFANWAAINTDPDGDWERFVIRMHNGKLALQEVNEAWRSVNQDDPGAIKAFFNEINDAATQVDDRIQELESRLESNDLDTSKYGAKVKEILVSKYGEVINETNAALEANGFEALSVDKILQLNPDEISQYLSSTLGTVMEQVETQVEAQPQQANALRFQADDSPEAIEALRASIQALVSSVNTDSYNLKFVADTSAEGLSAFSESLSAFKELNSGQPIEVKVTTGTSQEAVNELIKSVRTLWQQIQSDQLPIQFKPAEGTLDELRTAIGAALEEAVAVKVRLDGAESVDLSKEQEAFSQLNDAIKAHSDLMGKAELAELSKGDTAIELTKALEEEAEAFKKSADQMREYVKYLDANSQKLTKATQLSDKMRQQLKDQTTASQASEAKRKAETAAIEQQTAALQRENAELENNKLKRQEANALGREKSGQAKAWNTLNNQVADYADTAKLAEKEAEYNSLVDTIHKRNGDLSQAQIAWTNLKKQLDDFRKEARKTTQDVNKANSAQLSNTKLQNKLTDYYHQFERQIKLHPELLARYNTALESLKTDKFNQNTRQAAKEVQDFMVACEEAGINGIHPLQNLIGGFWNKLKFGSLAALAGSVRRLARQVYTNVVEIDDAMTQLRIVTGATGSEMNQFFAKSTDLASKLGKSVKDVLGSIETFSRLGYTLEESSTLAEYANILSNVANVDASAATTGLTSIIKGYNLEVSDSEHIADVLINVGQKYAISASELMDAFERGGAALYASGTEFEKSAALFAASNSAIQNADKVGTAFQTVSARIRKSESELEELGADYEDIANGMSKYRDELKALTNVNGTGGFDIMMDADHYKDIYDIFVGIAEVWDKMTDPQRARTAEILGGTRQLSIISSTIAAISDAEGALNDAMNSTGVAAAAQDLYMQSITGHIQQLSADFQKLSYDLLNSNIVKNIVDAADAAVKFIDKMAEAKAIVPTLVAAGAALAVIVQHAKVFGYAKYIDILKESIKGLSGDALDAAKSMLGVAEANKKVAATATGLTTGIGLVVSVLSTVIAAYQKYKQEQREAWEAGVEAGKSAKDNADELTSLVAKYEELVEARKTDLGVQRELYDAQKQLSEALGNEGLSVDNLAKRYRGLTTSRLADARIAAQSAVSDAESFLFDATRTKSKIGITVGVGDSSYGIVTGWSRDSAATNQSIIEALRSAGFAPSSETSRGAAFDFIDEDLTTVDSILRVYEQVAQMRRIAGDIDVNSNVFESLDKIYRGLSDAVTQYTTTVSNNNEVVAQEILWQQSLSNELPQTEEEFKKYRASLIMSVVAGGNYINNGIAIGDVIDALLSKDDRFVRFFEDGADAVNDTAGAVYNAATSFEKLDKFKDAISSLNDAFDDLSADDSTGITYSHLKKIKEEFADVDGVDTYIARLSAAGTNAEEVNKILNELATAKLRDEAATLAGAGANEDLIRALLEEAGVTNAAETAADTLAVAEGKVALQAAIAKGKIDEFIDNLRSEAVYSDNAKNELYRLAAQMILTNQTNMDMSQQINELKKVALAAGVASVAVASVVQSIDKPEIVKPSQRGLVTDSGTGGGSALDKLWALIDEQTSGGTTAYDFADLEKDKTSSGGGSSSSKTENETRIEEIVKEYENATSSLQYELNLLERQYEHLEANGDLDGMNANLAKQAELQQQLKDAAHKTADELRAFRDEAELAADEAAEVDKQLDALSSDWYDADKDRRAAMKQSFDNQLEALEDYIDRCNDLNDWGADNEVDARKRALDLLEDANRQGLLDYKDYCDQHKDMTKALYDAEMDALNDYVDAMQKAIDKQKEFLEEQKEAVEKEMSGYDAVVNALSDLIDDVTSSLEDENSELEKQKELQEKLMELERLKNQKTLRIYRDGVGFVYEADTVAIQEAQDAYDALVDDINNDEAQKRLDKLKEAIQNITGRYGLEKDKALAAAILGPNWESSWSAFIAKLATNDADSEAIFSSLLDEVQDYTDEYSLLSSKVDEDVEGSISDQIKSLDDLSDAWDDWLDGVKDANYQYVDALDYVGMAEMQIFSNRYDTLSTFVDASVAKLLELNAAMGSSGTSLSGLTSPFGATIMAPAGTTLTVSDDSYEGRVRGLSELAYSDGAAVRAYADENGNIGAYYIAHAKSVAHGQTADAALAYLDAGIRSGQISKEDAASALNEIIDRSSIQSNREKYRTFLHAIEDLEDDDYDRKWREYASGGVVDYTGPAIVHGATSSEVIFNGKDAKKLYEYVHATPDLVSAMLARLGIPAVGGALNIGASVKPSQYGSVNADSNTISIDIGSIILNEVQDVNGLAKAIEMELPAAITQMLYKR